MTKLKSFKGSIILLTAAAIWGTSFVAQTSARDSVEPFTFISCRSFLATAVLAVYIFFFAKNSRKSVRDAFSNKKLLKRYLLVGSLCGLALFTASCLQQIGITVYSAEVTNISGRSAFLTAMYVVLVPVFGTAFKKKAHPLVWVAVVMSIVALYLLCMKGGFGSIDKGDLITLACAVCFTLHIIIIDNMSGKLDSIVISFMQFFITGVLSLIILLFAEKNTTFSDIRGAWLSIAYSGLMSGGIAYTLQIVGQKTTDPAVASVIMSLESVFATLGGCIVLGETLSLREGIGSALMFTAVITSQLPGFIKQKQTDK